MKIGHSAIACVLTGVLFFASLMAEAQEAKAPLGPTLTRISARQVLYLGYRETAFPFSYMATGQSEPKGYGIDLCMAVHKVVQDTLGKSVRIVPVSMTDNARTMMLKTGMIDLDCSMAGNTVARQKQVTFSHNVYVSEIRVMARQVGGITSVEALNGKRVVTVVGSIAERQIKQAALGSSITMLNLMANTPAEAMAMLSKGEVDAFVAEDALLAGQRAVNQGEFVLLDAVLGTEPYGIMLPKDDLALKKLVDETLDGMMQSGELSRLYDKWFMNPIPPDGRNLKLTMPEMLKAAIREPNDTPVN